MPVRIVEVFVANTQPLHNTRIYSWNECTVLIFIFLVNGGITLKTRETEILISDDENQCKYAKFSLQYSM